MKRIALLIKETPVVDDDNFRRFIPPLLNLGFSVDVLFIDSLRLAENRLEAQGFNCKLPLPVGSEWPPRQYLTINHPIVWLLGLGDRHTFLDKYQLLHVIETQATLINSTSAIMHLKSKYLLAAQAEFMVPETHADNRPEALLQIIENKGGDWILKPPAGSLGEGVQKISADNGELAHIVQKACAGSGYTMLQRYLPEIEKGEKRVIIAGGEVITQYLRRPGPDHRTNLSQGGQAEACELTEDEKQLCNRLGKYLLDQGAWFCGIDLAYPWLIELNVINPGGIVTVEALTGVDYSKHAVDAVLAALP